MITENKICQNCKSEFVIKPDDLTFYQRLEVPSPNLCPDCRFRRRLAFRNERSLYNQTCKLCGDSVITMYHPSSPYVVYCNECWRSDKWDAQDYAFDYDPTRSFFEQLKELTLKVPKSATYASIAEGPNINSEYTNFAGANKNCYLIFNAGTNNEDSAYMRGFGNSRNVFDSYYGYDSEKIYECINSHKNSGVLWSQNINDCLNSFYLLNCSGLTNCFGCVNLRHKSYYFLNEPLEKNEWQEKVEEIIGSYKKTEEFKNIFREFSLKFPRRENNNLKSVNSVGDYIFESKSCYQCFEVSRAENVSYAFSVKNAKDSLDVLGYGRKSELLLECNGVGVSKKVIGSWWVENSEDIGYSFATRSSQNCFGCDGIKNGKNMILNKKYGEAEYQKIKSTIIAELKSKNAYGLFFPPELAFFAWNETLGQDCMPLTEETAKAQGYRWQAEIQVTRGKETIKSGDIPDHIKDVPYSILEAVLRCEDCERNYRIIKSELDFYKQAIIPIPRKCFYCRYADRLKRRGPFKLFDRNCVNCEKSIKTIFSTQNPEIVWCESCYNSEVA